MNNMIAPPTLLIAVVDFYGLSKGKERSAYQKEQAICELEKNEEKISSHKKVVAESPVVEQQDVSDTVVQMRYELSQKNADVERLLIENEKLKTELAQAQLLIIEKEEKKATTCVPSEPHATVRLLDNTGNSVHSQIRGDGDSLDRVEGAAVSLGGSKMNYSNRGKRRLSSYLGKELCAIKFSDEDFRKAIFLFWQDPDLKGLPKWTPDGQTLFVLKEAVEILQKKGLSFEESGVVSAGELPPLERAQMRERYGM